MVSLGAGTLLMAATSAQATVSVGGPGLPGGYKHLVVIYQENQSFDSVLGYWGSVGGQAVDGLQNGGVAQVDQQGQPFTCLPQSDVNLTSPPLAATCTDPVRNISSAFTNNVFTINDVLPTSAKTCELPGTRAPAAGIPDGEGGPGGCTRDLEHRFYQNIFQINGGKQDRFTLASDAVGLTQGAYDSTQLELYHFLHSPGAPNYVIADRFFQAAFGGSFLNHQFLVAARTPIDTSAGALGLKNSVLDTNGMPHATTLYTPTVPGVRDEALTPLCADPSVNDPSVPCGFYAINTAAPESIPRGTGTRRLATIDSAAFPTIGDRLTEAGITWTWYAGGWDAAVAGTPDRTFQAPHQPLNYFSNFAEGGPLRGHLQDESKLWADISTGALPTVSFYEPLGVNSEHASYASQALGNAYVTELIRRITTGPQAQDTLVLLTYDEYGGHADHVPVPKGDVWGPGPRIPAVLVSARMTRSGVDHTQYDTTSILATLNKAFGLAPLSARDASVNPLDNAILTGGLPVPPDPTPTPPPAPTPPPTPNAPTLAATGTKTLPRAEAGLLLCALGAALSVAARRRTQL